MKHKYLKRWRFVLGVVILSAIPAMASAHGLTGTNSWVDELICLIPALIMVALVLILGKDGQKHGSSKDAPKSVSIRKRPGKDLARETDRQERGKP